MRVSHSALMRHSLLESPCVTWHQFITLEVHYDMLSVSQNKEIFLLVFMSTCYWFLLFIYPMKFDKCESKIVFLDYPQINPDLCVFPLEKKSNKHDVTIKYIRVKENCYEQFKSTLNGETIFNAVSCSNRNRYANTSTWGQLEAAKPIYNSTYIYNSNFMIPVLVWYQVSVAHVYLSVCEVLQPAMESLQHFILHASLFVSQLHIFLRPACSVEYLWYRRLRQRKASIIIPRRHADFTK